MGTFSAQAKLSLASCVVSSVAEAELGAAFQKAQKAAEFRNTLHLHKIVELASAAPSSLQLQRLF